MGRGKFKGKPTGRRMFSTPEEISAGNSSARPRTFKNLKDEEEKLEQDSDQDQDHDHDQEQDQGKEEAKKQKGVQGIIDIVNPNLLKPKSVKARNMDTDQRTTTELSRREREEIEKQKAHERYMKLQEEGKTDQAKKDLERLALIRQQRSDAAKKRQEEKSNQKLKKNADLLLK